MSEQSTGKFVKGYFYHGVKISKWENQNGDRKTVSFSIEKSYKDKNTQEYKQSKTFFSDDLDSLMHCIIAMKRDSIKEIFPKEQTAQAEQVNEDENIPF